jgi:hypothetical protein
MSPQDQLEQLEGVLLQLGRLELDAERSLERLLGQIRALFAAGDDHAGEAALKQHDNLKNNLRALREQIYQVETELYAARRRQRR